MNAEMPPIEIRPDHWKIVQRILQEHVPDLEVWAFGSRAKWSAKEFSDLDLAIITDEPLPIDTSSALSEAFSESDLPWKVDVVDWSGVSGFRRSVIENSKVVIQEVAYKSVRKIVTLGEICQEQNGCIQTGPFGSQLHAYDYSVNGTPVVMPVNIVAGRINELGIARISDSHVERLIRHKLEPGDIVFSRRGDVTRFALVSNRESGWVCGTGCLKVAIGTPSMAIPRYIAAVLSTRDSKEWLERHAVGATMPNLNTEILAALPVVLPPIHEQRAIAHILGVLDDKIELNRKQSETLEAMARAMFKAWFVDFEPVRAKMEGRWKRGQSLPGMPAHLYDLFPDRMVESELGDIPEGWHVLSFEDLASQRKEVVKPGGFPNDMFFHYSIPAFDAGKMPVCELGESIRSNKSVVHDGFVLISKLNPHIPRVWNVGEAGASAVCSTEFTVWEAKEPANGAFLYCLASLDVFSEALCQLVTGTSNSHQRVKPEQFKGIRVFSAVEELISGFSMVATAILESSDKRRIESADLSRVRDVLLPKLVSGELRISEAKRFLDKRGVLL